MKAIILLALACGFSANADVFVNGYERSNETYVPAHYRTAPDHNPYNNYSTQGNVNPYNGNAGTVNPYQAPAFHPTQTFQGWGR